MQLKIKLFGGMKCPKSYRIRNFLQRNGIRFQWTDELGMRKLSLTAAEELLEIFMRRYEHASTLLTSNRPVDGCGKLLGESAVVAAMLDRLLHHGHVLKCGPGSWRTKTGGPVEGQ